MSKDLSNKFTYAGPKPFAVKESMEPQEVEGTKFSSTINLFHWYHQKQGNYSENDKHNWTPELRKVLNFDQMQALQVDNGKYI